ncbi:MAG TPA: twin-arginine translocase TatA/TatE family subunit [Candidatus Acidoferrum sp.]|nr:twin-arginine translocase TatA/TatE family subunit [Candidatus Acidoferrum sp.]
MTHMIVVFVIALVVFGPQKLPELARSLGKLMAEFRKASTDFKFAFEQEMRDMERQALQAERKKAADAAAASAATAPAAVTPAALPETTSATSRLDGENGAAEALVVTPAADAVPRTGAVAPEQTEPAEAAEVSAAEPVGEDSQALSHDQQQPA